MPSIKKTQHNSINETQNNTFTKKIIPLQHKKHFKN